MILALSEGTGEENLKQIVLSLYWGLQNESECSGSSPPACDAITFQHKIPLKELRNINAPRILTIPGYGYLIRNLEDYTVEGTSIEDARIILQLKYRVMEKKEFHRTVQTIPSCSLDALQHATPESILRSRGSSN